MLIGVRSGRRGINFPPLLSRLWGDIGETDRPEQSEQPPRTGARRRPFYGFSSREGAGRMVFCVPDSFLRRGRGTAGLEGVAGEKQAVVVPWGGPEKPSQWLPKKVDGWGGCGKGSPGLDVALAQSLTAAEPRTGRMCYLGKAVYSMNNSTLNLTGAESMVWSVLMLEQGQVTGTLGQELRRQRFPSLGCHLSPDLLRRV